jgi:hypothetical protein
LCTWGTITLGAVIPSPAADRHRDSERVAPLAVIRRAKATEDDGVPFRPLLAVIYDKLGESEPTGMSPTPSTAPIGVVGVTDRFEEVVGVGDRSGTCQLRHRQRLSGSLA